MEFKPSYTTIENFYFQSGESLDVKLEYFTMGKAKRDDEGKIQNGLLFLHGWSGDYTSFKRFLDFTASGQVFDEDEYFIISTTALGSPGSSAPSTSGLGKNFPHYTIGDMVNIQYRLLTECLDIDHLKGVIGTSMGGFQSLKWGVNYPIFMDFVINIVTGPAVMGRNQAIFQTTNNIIEDHPDYMEGNYRKNPLEAVKCANQLMFLFAFSIPYYHKEFKNKESLLKALNVQGDEGMSMDARDIVWRNNAALNFDIRNDLTKIRAKIPLSESIENSELLVYKSDLGHLGINEIEKMNDALISFIEGI
jgi:homoserine O-acetyltransferase/O-succinyltransferase